MAVDSSNAQSSRVSSRASRSYFDKYYAGGNDTKGKGKATLLSPPPTTKTVSPSPRLNASVSAVSASTAVSSSSSSSPSPSLDDLFAGPSRTRLRYDPASNDYCVIVDAVPHPRERQRTSSSAYSFASMTAQQETPPPPQRAATAPPRSIADIVQSLSPSPTTTRAKSIDEIIREHSPSLVSRSPTIRQRAQSSSSSSSSSSLDSIDKEIRSSLTASTTPDPKPPPIRHSSAPPSQTQGRRLLPKLSRSSLSPTSPSYNDSFESSAFAAERELATLLRSPRLTRLLTLRRPPNVGLTVSLADVGSQHGHPVIVFLGLGCVRYLVALYDEITEVLGLRIICIDRWGLGRTDDVKQRGFAQWSHVVSEVADQLALTEYSILAHSAGAPYAFASSLREPHRVRGSIHLLAPWTSVAADSLNGAYKYIKYVPSGIVRSAQAAEWKLTAWRLGKPPTIAYEPVGFNHRSGIGSADFPLDIAAADDDCDGESETGVDASPSLRRAKSGSLRSVKIKRSKPLLTERRSTSVGDESRRSSMLSQSSSSIGASPTSALSGSELAIGLMRASYAESLKGGTADLMAILDRDSYKWGFRHEDVVHPVKIWHGDKDERISLASVKRLQDVVRDCTLNIVPGADHSLMTNASVMFQVLESIASEWK